MYLSFFIIFVEKKTTYMATKHYKTRTVSTTVGDTVESIKETAVWVSSPDIYHIQYHGSGSSWTGRVKMLSTLKIYFALVERLGMDSMEVYLSPTQREEIMEECQVSRPMFTLALKELEEFQVILRGTIVDKNTGQVLRTLRRGELILNPHIVWRGGMDRHREAVKEFDSIVRYTEGF